MNSRLEFIKFLFLTVTWVWCWKKSFNIRLRKTPLGKHCPKSTCLCQSSSPVEILFLWKKQFLRNVIIVRRDLFLSAHQKFISSTRHSLPGFTHKFHVTKIFVSWTVQFLFPCFFHHKVIQPECSACDSLLQQLGVINVINVWNSLTLRQKLTFSAWSITILCSFLR